MDELEQEREAGLQADHPEAGLGELAVLLDRCVGRVVGGDAVDGPGGEGLDERVDVPALAEGRVDLADDKAFNAQLG